MKYMLLITSTDGGAECSTSFEDWQVFDKAVQDAGILVSAHSLADFTTATTVRVDAAGEPTITDGPFAETREVLGGFYVIDVPDLDAALRLGRPLPGRPRRRLGRGPAGRRLLIAWTSSRTDGHGDALGGGRVPRGARPAARRARPPLRRPGPGRGGRLRGDRGGAGALAGRRRTAAARRLADDHGPPPGRRPAAPRPGVRRPARRARRSSRSGPAPPRPPTPVATICPTSGCSSSSPAPIRRSPPRTGWR